MDACLNRLTVALLLSVGLVATTMTLAAWVLFGVLLLVQVSVLTASVLRSVLRSNRR